ncbi:MAG: SIR2 family NAD-dependent protein deacylase [Candidatus Jordarchaeum sp.]|uniref:SIR2 family NAD-dependent protein deacylase n=1 Tax=Candidatus Jordarchaeum sp. TaxID=2823881 RepID=UPI00404ACF8E
MSFSTEDIEKVAELISNSSYLVAFTGAGISTESGLPDYRGPEGVWTLRDKGLKPKPPTKPWNQIEPNPGHYALIELYNMGKLKYLISQNVDNLHIKSGIPREILAELHGNYTVMKCLTCDARFTKEEIGWDDQLHGKGYRTHNPLPNQPLCTNCGGRIISSVVNFGDPMPEREMAESLKQAERCDLMLVIGSSLSVSPANQFPIIAKRRGAKIVIINMGETQLEEIADVRIFAKSGEFLSKVVDKIKSNK